MFFPCWSGDIVHRPHEPRKPRHTPTLVLELNRGTIWLTGRIEVAVSRDCSTAGPSTMDSWRRIPLLPDPEHIGHIQVVQIM